MVIDLAEKSSQKKPEDVHKGLSLGCLKTSFSSSLGGRVKKDELKVKRQK